MLQGLQFALVVIALAAVWSKTRLYNDDDNSIIMDLITTDVKSNIKMYADGNAYDIVLLIAVFVFSFQSFDLSCLVLVRFHIRTSWLRMMIGQFVLRNRLRVS